MENRANTVGKYTLLLSMIGAVVLAYLVTSAMGYFFPDMSNGASWIISFALTYVLAKWLSKILFAIISVAVYKGDMDGITKELLSDINPPNEDENENIVSVQIVNIPDAPIGRYLDGDIYEWLDISGAGFENKRVYFAGTVDPKNTNANDIPDDCMLFPPGVLYSFCN